MSTTRWLEAGTTRAAAPLAAVTLAAMLGGCTREASGPARTEQRGVDAFHSVDLRGAGDASVEVGGTTSLSLTADDATLRDVKTSVLNGTLIIENHSSWHGSSLQMHLTIPELRSFAVNGAGTVKIHGVHSNGLMLVVDGAGKVVADGTTTALNARINGAGDMDLAQLGAGDTALNIKGAGHIRAQVAGSLDAKIVGAGKIEYSGSPTSLTTQVAGAGTITGMQQ